MQELLIKVRALREGYGRPQSGLSEDDLKRVLAQVETHLTAQIVAEQAKPEEERKARKAQIKQVLDVLSVSELEALAAIAHAVDERQPTLLVCSDIAGKAGVTRTIVTNALRKVESAGVIHMRSLGRKGSRIETLVPGWTAEVIERAGA